MFIKSTCINIEANLICFAVEFGAKIY